MIWLLLSVQSVISAFGLLLIRSSMPQILSKGFQAGIMPILGGGLGVLFYAASFLLWMFILGKNPVSFAYPVTIGLTTLITVSGSVLFLKESVSFTQILGIVLLIAAVALIGYKQAA